MKKALKVYLPGGLAVLALALFVAWKTSPDPMGNPGSFEDAPLVMSIAPLNEAITLAQIRRDDGTVATLLVTDIASDAVTAVDLSALSADDDPFAVIANSSDEALTALAADTTGLRTYSMSNLLPAAPGGDRHIGTGTNFPEHAAEASSDAVFQFPKFGRAMGARSAVAWDKEVLLDYEVELCMRADRPIASDAGFDAAVKGLFLCGDFTDRGKLVRLVDPDNLDSGRGFSDGKSREDFYPAGALLVIPRDWPAFVARERMATYVNGEQRQDARGGEMTLDFRALALAALSDMARPRFLYRDDYYRLAPNSEIAPESTLMSGTAEGVIFTAPTRGDIIEGLSIWLFGGRWMHGHGPIDTTVEVFIANELASGHYLQPGNRVEHRSRHLGNILVEVKERDH